MKHNINYRLRKLSHGLSSVGIVAVMLGTTVPFSTANVSDNLNPENVAQAVETNEDYEKTYDIVYLGDIESPFKEQEVKSESISTSTDDEGKQSPSEKDSNEVTEPVYDSSDVTKEQKQGQPELAETGVQKESNRLALLGIAGIGIVIAGTFFFLSRRDKK